MHKDEAPQAALAETGRLLRGFQVARMIQVAAELGLADRVAEGPERVDALAAAAGADPAMLVRLCRALAAFGIFAVEEEGPRLRQTARSAWLATGARPTLHDAARYWGTPGTWEVWGGLEATVRTGVPAQEARFGMAFFPFLASRPEAAERFDAFMRNSPDDRHRAVAAAWDFAGAGLVVDVGGGNGGLLAAIEEESPHRGKG
ncbi:MAG TPA: methyltransferase, partial [Amaricoccus sp.]|nr:methyltransferase [Amaricoccus sp.]